MQVRVWNDNVHPFKQTIDEIEYVIPAGKFVEMDEAEADKLLKAYSPILVDYDGRPRPESYKKLRLDTEDLKRNAVRKEARNKSGSYICQACGYVASNKWELNGHVMDEHKHQFDDNEEALKEIKKDESQRKKA